MIHRRRVKPVPALMTSGALAKLFNIPGKPARIVSRRRQFACRAVTV
jgi:hypothetical protein